MDSIKNNTNCFYFDSIKYIRFESDKQTNNFSLPTQSQLNCIGGDGCAYSKYLNWIDCYNVGIDYLGYSKWNCYSDKYFNYYVYPKLVEFGTFIVECENCPETNLNSNSNTNIDYNQQLIYSFESDVKKINGSCSLNYQMYKIDLNQSFRHKSSNIQESYLSNQNLKFLFVCVGLIIITALIFIIGYKIFYLIYDYYKKNKYVKLTNKDFENTILINNNSYQKEYKSFEIV
jgi:hypothetical protein